MMFISSLVTAIIPPIIGPKHNFDMVSYIAFGILSLCGLACCLLIRYSLHETKVRHQSPPRGEPIIEEHEIIAYHEAIKYPETLN